MPVITVSDYEQAIELANGTGNGLQMAVFTRDIDKAFYFAQRLRTGNVVINDTTDYWEAHEPFGGGGGTRSGYGRLGGRFTFEDMTHLKTVALHINDLTPNAKRNPQETSARSGSTTRTRRNYGGEWRTALAGSITLHRHT